MQIQYVKGDATQPQGVGHKIIAHIVNDLGVWGAGFVVSLGRRYPDAENAYRAWARHGNQTGQVFALGRVQIVDVGVDLSVANMVAQHGVGWDDPTTPPIRYDALQRALRRLSTEAYARNASVHMPRIGTGLAGGSWDRIEPLIAGELISTGIAVTVYDLP